MAVIQEVVGSDVVETVTFEIETETWLKFRDETEIDTWLKFRDETETETSSKTPRPRLETWSSRLRLETSKFVHFAEIFQKNVVITSDHGRPQKRTFHPLEIETMHQDSLENMKLVAQFRSIDYIFAMPLYFPAWHSHCTIAKFTFLVSCSGELAVHSCSLLCVAKLGSEFFWCWCLLRNNITAANLQRFASSYDKRRFAQCCHC